MLPRALCKHSVHAGGPELAINYLTERDHVWLRALLDEYERFRNRKASELQQRLQEPLTVRAPKHKLRVARHVLDRVCATRENAAVAPREARRAVFSLAALESGPRQWIFQQSAATLGVGAVELEAALFADLKSERLLGSLPEKLGPAKLAEQANLAIVGGLLGHSREVRIVVYGKSRAVVRQARLCGLICTVEHACRRESAGARAATGGLDALSEPAVPGVVLHVSGPLALFRQTRIYARALASLIPRVTWCDSYEITAQCALAPGAELVGITVRSGDPIPAGRELQAYDSQLEQRFARDFTKLATDWDIIREPGPIDIGSGLVFPDFALVSRQRRECSAYLEIAGFWTRGYLEKKLTSLKRAGIERLILCIDEKRCCGEQDFPQGAEVIRYKRRIDAKQVLARLQAMLRS